LKTRIAVDAMGGDYAPGEIIRGAILGAEAHDVEITLVGQPEVLEAELDKYDITRLPISCVEARESIRETENPALAVRRKTDASINVATRLLRDGEVDGLISAGPSGAVAVSAMQNLGMIEGVERPVIGGVIFDALPNTVVFDCGINLDCKPHHLLTFAAIGVAYCRRLLGMADPTVGLFNIGREETKGSQLTREAHALLKKSGLNFIGNLEGNQIMNGQANVLVCDAMVGNVLFKFVESVGLFHDSAGDNASTDLGGGLIWGARGIVRKLHGASRAAHVALKVGQVKLAVEADLINAVTSELASAAAAVTA